MVILSFWARKEQLVPIQQVVKRYDLRFHNNPASFIALKQGQTQTLQFSYTVSNEFGQTEPENVTLHVVGSNEAPDASSDTYMYENTPGSVFMVDAANGLLGHHDLNETTGDTDADGDPHPLRRRREHARVREGPRRVGSRDPALLDRGRGQACGTFAKKALQRRFEIAAR